MEISEDTRNIIEYLDEFSGNKLRKKNDLATLLEIGAGIGNFDTVNRLIFSGKTVWNLYSKLRKLESAGSGTNVISGEFHSSADETLQYMNELIGFGADEDKKRFGEIYFAGTSGSMKNLIDLCYDLTQLKNLQSDIKNNAKKEND